MNSNELLRKSREPEEEEGADEEVREMSGELFSFTEVTVVV